MTVRNIPVILIKCASGTMCSEAINMSKKKNNIPEVNMSAHPPGKDKPGPQKEPGVSDETRVVYAEEVNVRDGSAG